MLGNATGAPTPPVGGLNHIGNSIASALDLAKQVQDLVTALHSRLSPVRQPSNVAAAAASNLPPSTTPVPVKPPIATGVDQVAAILGDTASLLKDLHGSLDF